MTITYNMLCSPLPSVQRANHMRVVLSHRLRTVSHLSLTGLHVFQPSQLPRGLGTPRRFVSHALVHAAIPDGISRRLSGVFGTTCSTVLYVSSFRDR